VNDPGLVDFIEGSDDTDREGEKIFQRNTRVRRQVLPECYPVEIILRDETDTIPFAERDRGDRPGIIQDFKVLDLLTELGFLGVG
jgi:hypothetical protein